MFGGGGGGLPGNLDLNTLLQPIVKELKNIVIPALQEQLSAVKMPSTEGTSEAAGGINYRIGEIALTQVIIPQENLLIDVKGLDTVFVRASKLVIGTNKFTWHYDKLSFPKISSGGSADCKIEDVSIMMEVKVRVGGSGPQLNVTNCKVVIGNLDIKLSDTKLKHLYGLLIGLFRGQVKQMLEQTLTNAAKDAVEKSGSSFLS